MDEHAIAFVARRELALRFGIAGAVRGKREPSPRLGTSRRDLEAARVREDACDRGILAASRDERIGQRTQQVERHVVEHRDQHVDEGVPAGRAIGAVERRADQSCARRRAEHVRLALHRRRDAAPIDVRLAERRLRDQEECARATVVRRKRERVLGGRLRARRVAGVEACLREREAARHVPRGDAGCLGPRRFRAVEQPERPLHLAQVEARVAVVGRRGDRAAEAQHRVNRTPTPLVLASALEPVDIGLRRHLRRAFNASRTNPGVSARSSGPADDWRRRNAACASRAPGSMRTPGAETLASETGLVAGAGGVHGR